MLTLIPPFDAGTRARVRSLGLAIRANENAKALYGRDPIRNAILIQQCDTRISEAQVELTNLEAVLDSIEAGAAQAEADARRGI